MSEITEKFGNHLREFRKSKKISQEKLALLSGIDRGYMGRIERGEVNVGIEKIYQIAAALDCHPKDLIPE